MSKTSLHPDTRLGYVHLTVSDLNRSVIFYRQALGFKEHRLEGDTAYLGAGGADLLVLTEHPGARFVSGTTGLFHLAILVPSRLALAQTLKRLADMQTRVDGFADHLVSEAIYLSDPDGNGIEIYRDRPRPEWEYYPNGHLKMATDPLDIHGILAEVEHHPEPWPGLPVDTILGHMHLRVADIARAESFYQDILGFDLMTRYGPAASFLSAGGYHHHIGINTWASAGASPPPPGSVGLRWFAIYLSDQADLSRVTDRVRQAGLPFEEQDEGLFLHDPSHNAMVLMPRPGK